MIKTPKFRTGAVVATPRAIDAFAEAHVEMFYFLKRHLYGDWGDLDDEDKASNDAAVVDGDRILSAYTLPTGSKIWIITEADRSATTFLLPEDY